MSKKIMYNIGFNVDETGLQKVKTEINNIKNMSFKEVKLIDSSITEKEFDKIKTAATKLEEMLSKSFNTKLGTFNLGTFSEQLAKSEISVKSLAADLSKAGATGTNAFRNVAKEALTANDSIRKTSKWLESIGNTFVNTVKWSIASSVLNSFTSAVQQAWSYTVKLDTSLNDIRIVTGKSAEEMETFAKQANKAAKELGAASTTNFTNAALIYYQQGLGEEDVQARSRVTVKAANVTGQSAAEVSEQLTAVWNGYKVVAEEAELYVDKLAAVAASTAADLEELSTGMSKVASAANAMGVDVDQLSAQLSTIISVTRQDAAVVGTALKTIYSRMADLKVEGADEFGITLGDVSSDLSAVGIEVLDSTGNLRDMGTVIEEVAGKWGTWTDAQQQAIAISIAGKRQFNNLLALFENWDMYESALNVSQTSEGTLQKQQETYMDSIKAGLNELSVAGEKVFDALFDNEGVKNLLKDLSNITSWLADVITGFGGLQNILVTLGGLLPQIFKSSIVSGFSKTITNVTNTLQSFNEKGIKDNLTKQFGEVNDEGIEKMTKAKQEQLKMSRLLTDEEKAQYDLYIKKTAEAYNELDILEEKKKKHQEYHHQITGVGNQNWTPENAASRLEGVAEGYRTQATDFSKTAKTTKKLEGVLGSDVIKKSTRELEKYKKENSEVANEIDELIKIKNEENKIFEIVGKTSPESLKKIEIAQGQYNKGVIDSQTYNKILVDTLKDVAEETDNVAAEIREESVEYDRVNEKIKEQDKNYQELSESQKSKKIAENITNVVSAGMALVSVFNSLTNIADIWSDKTMSEGEKVTATISGIVSAGMSIIPVITMIVQALVAGGKEASLAWTWVTVIAVALMAVVTVVSIIAKAVEAQKTALEKAEEAATKAEEATKRATERAAELKEEYESINSEIDKFKSARDNLNKMTRGTEEWKKAVQELNFQVIDLITRMPELAAAFTYDNGIFELNEKAYNDIMAEKQREVLIASRVVNASNIALTQANQNYIKEKREEDFKNIITGTDYFGGNWSERYNEGKVSIISSNDFSGTGAPKINTTNLDKDFGIGYSSTTSTQGYNKTTTSTLDFSTFLENLKNADDTQLQSYIQKLEENDYGDEMEKVILDAIKTQQENNKKLAQQQSAIDANTQAIIASMATEEGVDANFYKAALLSSTTQSVTDFSKQFTEDFKTNFTDKVKAANVKETIDTEYDAGEAKDAITEYFAADVEEFGIDLEISKSKILEQGLTSDELDLAYVTVNGTEMTVADLAALIAQKKYEKQGEELNADIKAIQESEEDLLEEGALFMDGREANVSDWTSDTYAKYQKILKDADKYSAIDSTFSKKAVETAQTAFISGIQTIYEKAVDSNGELLNQYSNFTEDDFNTLKNLETRIGSADSSQEGLLDKFNTVLQGYEDDPEKYLEIVKKANAVNWGDIKSVGDFLFNHTASIQEKVRKKELDYFKNINKELDTFNREIERNLGLQKQAFLTEKVETLKNKSAIAQTNLANDKDVLNSYISSYGYEEYLDENGNINVSAVNDAIAALNPDIAEDKTEIDRLNNLLGYWDDIIESENEAAELQAEIVDAQIAAFNYQFEYQQKLYQSARRLRDIGRELEISFGEETGQDKLNNALISLGDLREDAGLSFDKLDSYARVTRNGNLADISNIFKGANGKIDWAKFDEAYNTAIDEAFSTLKDMKAELVNIYNSYLQIQEDIFNLYDKELEKLKQINSIYSNMADLGKIIGKETSGYYQGIWNNVDKSYEVAINQYAAAQTEFNKLFDASGNRIEGVTDEMVEKVTENLTKASENVADLAKEKLESVANYYSAFMADKINEAIRTSHNGLNLAQASEAWELARASEEGYLDSVNATYGIDQLGREYQKSIDETDSYNAQRKLIEQRAKMEERLNSILRERGKLSQYELDRANAEYELTLKQIALEEAQQTSNKMKLTRDAFGNYTYQYVQDEDAVAKAQEELAAAENNLYNMDRERTQTLVSEYYSTMTEANEAIAEAMRQGDEERARMLEEHYFGPNGLISGIQSELKSSSSFLKDIGSIITNTTFADGITKVADQIASMPLFGENGLLTTLNNELSKEGGGFSKLAAATAGISDLLSETGILQTVVTAVQKTEGNLGAINTKAQEFSASATKITTELPSLVGSMDTLTEKLKGYAEAYDKWLKDKTNGMDFSAVTKNTEALKDLTETMVNFADRVADGQLDGQGIEITGYHFDSTTNTWVRDDMLGQSDQ